MLTPGELRRREVLEMTDNDDRRQTTTTDGREQNNTAPLQYV